MKRAVDPIRDRRDSRFGVDDVVETRTRQDMIEENKKQIVKHFLPGGVATSTLLPPHLAYLAELVAAPSVSLEPSAVRPWLISHAIRAVEQRGLGRHAEHKRQCKTERFPRGSRGAP